MASYSLRPRLINLKIGPAKLQCYLKIFGPCLQTKNIMILYVSVKNSLQCYLKTTFFFNCCQIGILFDFHPLEKRIGLFAQQRAQMKPVLCNVIQSIEIDSIQYVYQLVPCISIWIDYTGSLTSWKTIFDQSILYTSLKIHFQTSDPYHKPRISTLG